METEQRNAYQEAIQDYRAAASARMAKSANLPRRQISNYFVQFRKVSTSVTYFL